VLEVISSYAQPHGKAENVPTRRRTSRLTPLVLTLALGACAGPSTSGGDSVIRDSAGITIVDNPDPLAADSSGWAVDTAPTLRIGTADGPEHYSFGRIAGFARLADGRIVIADGQANRIHFYDPGGKHLSTVGGPGSGPGEYINFSRLLTLPGDSLMAIDYEGGRVTVLDPRGKWIRTYRPSLSDGRERRGTYPEPDLIFGDGTYLIRQTVPTCQSDSDGVCEDKSVFIHARDTSVIAEIGPMVSWRSERLQSRNGRPNVASDKWLAPVFFGVHGTRFFYADATTFEIRVYSGDGRLERMVRAAYEQRRPPPPTPGLRVAPGANPREQAVFDAFLELERRSTRPDRLRAYAGVELDAVGNMWVGEYRPHWIGISELGSSARWWVFDKDGVLRRAVRVPLSLWSPGRGSHRIEIGDDYLLGVTRDSLLVESLVMYRLRKNH
jgi:hypothetical protein